MDNYDTMDNLETMDNFETLETLDTKDNLDAIDKHYELFCKLKLITNWHVTITFKYIESRCNARATKKSYLWRSKLGHFLSFKKSQFLTKIFIAE